MADDKQTTKYVCNPIQLLDLLLNFNDAFAFDMQQQFSGIFVQYNDNP